VPSLYPSRHLFERVAAPDAFEALIELESETNPRIRQDLGQIDLIPRSERPMGPGSSVIMAAFTHLNPNGSRFSNGSFGVFYAGRSLSTSISETRYHRARFLRETKRGPMNLDMRISAMRVSDAPHARRYAAMSSASRMVNTS